MIWFIPLTCFLYLFNNEAKANSVVKVRSRELWSLCEGRESIVQLGNCSPYFLQCEMKEEAKLIQKCPFSGDVFMNGACQNALQFPECQDNAFNTANEETVRMAEQDIFCASGSGIYEVSNDDENDSCSRQALLCLPNRRDAISIGCSVGESITHNMSCASNQNHCANLPEIQTPIREFFLQKACFGNRTAQVQNVEANTFLPECSTWYISCSHRPLVVRCEPGYFFDRLSNRCKLWSQEESCNLLPICSGREFTAISLGQCDPRFIYCEGSIGKSFSCSEGMVFDGKQCSDAATVGCLLCSQGEKKRAEKCDEYYKCDYAGDQLAWKLKRCHKGMGWNEYTKKCEFNYTCPEIQECTPGSHIQLSCQRYLYCTGTKFEEFSCSDGSRFDEVTSNCVPDSSCRNERVRTDNCIHGQVIPTLDCKTYQECVNGVLVPINCYNEEKHLHGACSDCAIRTKRQSTSYLKYPARCNQGALRPHEEDCAAYYQCSLNQWQYSRCGRGEAFDSPTNSCVQTRFARCASSLQNQCVDGQRIFNEHSPQCDYLLECRNGVWIQMRCPQGTVYDVASRNCVSGTCSVRDGSYPDQIPSENGGSAPAPPPNDFPISESQIASSCVAPSRIADQYDCTRFWECTNSGKFVSRTCSPGYTFDSTSNNCNEGDNCQTNGCKQGSFQPVEECGVYRICNNGEYIYARCDRNMMFLNGKCIDTKCEKENVPSERQCRTGAVQPHESDIHSYMLCYYGHWTERTCNDGMVFDWQTLGCVRKNGQWAPTKPKCYPQETRPVPGQCQQYEVCEYGDWVRKACPYGQHFSNGFCVNGDCNAGLTCRESSGIDGYRRAQHDCTKFYQCANGVWVMKDCAPGTVFNSRISVCDFARNVPECGGY